VHLSILREYSNDNAALQQVASVITGGAAPPAPQPEDDMGTFKSSVRKKTGKLTNAWQSIGIDDDGSLSWLSGPCTFQAQANFTVDGVAADSVVRFRWITVRNSDGYTKPDAVNVWPTIEVPGTSGATYGQVIQFGKIGSPASGYTRRLRLQAYSDAPSGVTLTYLRSSSFAQ
jgi:hypothetical protein